MYQCGKCGMKFTRKDNVLRHLKNVCNVTHTSQPQVVGDTNQELKVAMPANENSDIIVDFFEILTIALSEQRREWKKEFKKFKKEMKYCLKETSNDENASSSDEEDSSSTDE